MNPMKSKSVMNTNKNKNRSLMIKRVMKLLHQTKSKKKSFDDEDDEEELSESEKLVHKRRDRELDDLLKLRRSWKLRSDCFLHG